MKGRCLQTITSSLSVYNVSCTWHRSSEWWFFLPWKKSRDTGKTTCWGRDIHTGKPPRGAMRLEHLLIGLPVSCLIPLKSFLCPLKSTSSPRPAPNNLLLLQTWAFTSHVTTPLRSMAFKGPFDQPLTPKPALPLVPAPDLVLDLLVSAMLFCTSILSWLWDLVPSPLTGWSEVKVAQSCPTLCDSMVSTVRGILQARILERVAFPFLQRIFPTQGSNTGLPHCGPFLYQLSHRGCPRVLEWVAYPFSRVSSWPRNRTRVSCITGRFFTNWTIREALMMLNCSMPYTAHL